MPVLRCFSGLFLFNGYKMATEKAVFCSQRRFSALASVHHAVQPVGYFGLLVGIEMAVGFHRGLHALMPQPFRDQQL